MDFLIKIFKALANENRVRMINLLLDGKEKEIGALADTLKLPYKTVARSMKILEHANMISSRRWGGYVYYVLKRDTGLEYNKFIYEMVKKRYSSPEDNSRILKKVRK
jgi:DNA-binding transcriptional ArsR family regulator